MNDSEFILRGIVRSDKNEPIAYATVCLENTIYGCSTNDKGEFYFKVPRGNYKFVVSAVGYEKHSEKITTRDTQTIEMEIILKTSAIHLEEVMIEGDIVGHVKQSPFNAVALDAADLRNSTKNISEALTQLPGMKLRETGGVGSDMQLMLDGFSGKHVKIFIDGVPQEGAGTALNINNIPINFAERIEVYKGVVPVQFGTDAIGGVINVVTNKNRRDWFLDASYTYGSFNTHKSSLNFGQTLNNGFLYEVNAFQNFSDNSYYIDNWVREFEELEDGTIIKYPVDKNDVKHVKRFNDQFHNETVIGKFGVVGKKWADRLIFSFTASSFYKEIQTGVYQDIVFGQKHRHGYSYIPSLEYKNNNFIIKNLDLTVNLNYNYNITHNIDTSNRYYNWYGEYYIKDTQGEQSYQNSESKNTNWNGTINLNYRIGDKHTFTFNDVISDFHRTSRAYVGSSSAITSFDIPKLTRKNISGLSYRFMPSEKWNMLVFGKHYWQYNQGPVSQSIDGIGNYINMERQTSTFGYGIAATYYIISNFQAKISYEKASRLPTTDELFGDEDLEAGKTDLKPEKSDNFNLNLNYHFNRNKHNFFVDGGFIYRNTKDYIKRGLGKHGSTQYGIYENHGHVITKGFNISLRYSFGKLINAGITFNNIDVRDYEQYWTGNSQQESLHYKVRLPNIPYRFANFDINVYWNDFMKGGNTLTFIYDNFWQHEFPLYWENIGSESSKNYVPTQYVHNLSLAYSIKNGKYNVSFECKNITNEQVYDNFSLQKAGRAFYVKFRVYLCKY